MHSKALDDADTALDALDRNNTEASDKFGPFSCLSQTTPREAQNNVANLPELAEFQANQAKSLGLGILGAGLV